MPPRTRFLAPLFRPALRPSRPATATAQPGEARMQAGPARERVSSHAPPFASSPPCGPTYLGRLAGPEGPACEGASSDVPLGRGSDWGQILGLAPPLPQPRDGFEAVQDART